MSLTLEQLRVLDAIDRSGSFAAAARVTQRVPSSVTYLVQELEASLGFELFDRSRRALRLTAAGLRMLEHARAVLTEVDRMEKAAAMVATGWEAELRIVIDAALPHSPLHALLARFAREAIPTRLRVDTECQEGVLDRFERHRADMALYLGFDSEHDAARFDLRPLAPLEMVLLVASEHPLALDATPERRERYAELVVRDTAERFAERPKEPYSGARNVAYLSDFHSKRDALLAGAGYGWMPLHLVAGDLHDGRLRELATQPTRWKYAPVLVMRRDGEPGRAARLCIEMLAG